MGSPHQPWPSPSVPWPHNITPPPSTPDRRPRPFRDYRSPPPPYPGSPSTTSTAYAPPYPHASSTLSTRPASTATHSEGPYNNYAPWGVAGNASMLWPRGHASAPTSSDPRHFDFTYRPSSEQASDRGTVVSSPFQGAQPQHINSGMFALDRRADVGSSISHSNSGTSTSVPPVWFDLDYGTLDETIRKLSQSSQPSSQKSSQKDTQKDRCSFTIYAKSPTLAQGFNLAPTFYFWFGDKNPAYAVGGYTIWGDFGDGQVNASLVLYNVGAIDSVWYWMIQRVGNKHAWWVGTVKFHGDSEQQSYAGILVCIKR
ncbi:hypothetical protein FA95DRAFT_1553939, partial [Auriscalpium vulgare]